MPLAECPTCHGKLSKANGQLYCEACGWNRDSAISSIRMSLNSLPIAVLMFTAIFAYVYWGMNFKNAPRLLIFWAIPAAGIIFNYISLKRSLTRLQAVNSEGGCSAEVNTNAIHQSAFTSATASATTPEEQVLLQTARPRTVRIAQRGKFAIAIAALAGVIFLVAIGPHLYSVWANTLSFATFGGMDWVSIALAALILLIPFAVWRSQVRECQLLENGEIAIGKVTRQWNTRSNSSIEYEFEDFTGANHEALGLDYTRKLYPGMSVAVFYDRDNPGRQVAYCSTQHEIVAS